MGEPGRPLIIETPAEFDAKVDDYRDWCTEHKRPVTFSGMAYHLGFASRQSFYDYEKREGFSYSVKRARLLVERMYEERMQEPSPAGAIFALKNHGWSDLQQISGPNEQPLAIQVKREVLPALPHRLASYVSGNGNGANGDHA